MVSTHNPGEWGRCCCPQRAGTVPQLQAVAVCCARPRRQTRNPNITPTAKPATACRPPPAARSLQPAACRQMARTSLITLACLAPCCLPHTMGRKMSSRDGGSMDKWAQSEGITAKQLDELMYKLRDDGDAEVIEKMAKIKAMWMPEGK